MGPMSRLLWVPRHQQLVIHGRMMLPEGIATIAGVNPRGTRKNDWRATIDEIECPDDAGQQRSNRRPRRRQALSSHHLGESCDVRLVLGQHLLRDVLVQRSDRR